MYLTIDDGVMKELLIKWERVEETRKKRKG